MLTADLGDEYRNFHYILGVVQAYTCRWTDNFLSLDCPSLPLLKYPAPHEDGKLYIILVVSHLLKGD